MNQELEALLKAWDAYTNAPPKEAEKVFELYQFKLTQVAALHRIPEEILHRMVKRAYQR